MGITKSYKVGDNEYQVLFSSGDGSCSVEQLDKSAPTEGLLIDENDQLIAHYEVSCTEDNANFKEGHTSYDFASGQNAINVYAEEPSYTSWEELEQRYSRLVHSGYNEAAPGGNTVGYSNANVSAKVKNIGEIQEGIDNDGETLTDILSPTFTDLFAGIDPAIDGIKNNPELFAKSISKAAREAPGAYGALFDLGARAIAILEVGRSEGFISREFADKITEEASGFVISNGTGAVGAALGTAAGIAAFGPGGAPVLVGIGVGIFLSYAGDRANQLMHKIGRDLKKDDGVQVQAEQIKENVNAPIVYDEPIGPQWPTLEEVLANLDDRRFIEQFIDYIIDGIDPSSAEAWEAAMDYDQLGY